MAFLSLRLIGGAGLLLAVVSCSSNDSTGPAGESIFPPAMVGTFGSSAEAMGENAPDAIGFGGASLGAAPSVLPAPEATAAAIGLRIDRLAAMTHMGTAAPPYFTSPSCSPTTVGGGTDTDGDGVPDDMTITYTAANCTTTDTATGSVHIIRGTIHYRDTGNSLYAYEFTITDLRAEDFDGSSGDWTRQILNGSETGSTTTTGGKWAFNLSGQLAQGNYNTVTTDQNASYNVTASYTPNIGTVPALGPLPDGSVTLAGTIDARIAPWGLLNTQLVTTQALAYTEACGGEVAGSIELRLNGNAAEGAEVKWLGCGSTKYEFLGSGAL